MVAAGDNHHRRFFEPVTGVGLRDFAFYGFVSKDNEMPGLKVTGRRGIPGGLEDLEQLFPFHRLIFVFPH